MLSAMHEQFVVEYLDGVNGKAVSFFWVSADNLAEAVVAAKTSFGGAQSELGARAYQVRNEAGLVVAHGPGGITDA